MRNAWTLYCTIIFLNNSLSCPGKLYKFDLDASDTLWSSFIDNSFPDVAEAVDENLKKYKDDVMKSKGSSSEDGILLLVFET